MKQSSTIAVMYDSITNSVFESQVMLPLLKRCKETGNKPVIISFEKKNVHDDIQQRIRKHNIHLIILKRSVALHRFTLIPARIKLARALAAYANATVIARGPLAGLLCIAACTPTTHLIIQARGLLAAEYSFTHNTTWWHRFRTRQFNDIEQRAYATQRPYTLIEAVSPALRTYLTTTWGTLPSVITVAHHDLPKAIAPSLIKKWRTQKRHELGISEHAHVYCYNGSAKPWQCPQETLDFFIEKYHQSKASHLLILTQDKAAFQELIKHSTLPTLAYTITSAPHHEIYHYLAAADIGLLFREKHPLNWVSRPTKLLEYQAVGLQIVHNGTVGYAGTAKSTNRPSQSPHTSTQEHHNLSI